MAGPGPDFRKILIIHRFSSVCCTYLIHLKLILSQKSEKRLVWIISLFVKLSNYTELHICQWLCYIMQINNVLLFTLTYFVMFIILRLHKIVERFFSKISIIIYLSYWHNCHKIVSTVRSLKIKNKCWISYGVLVPDHWAAMTVAENHGPGR